MPQPLAEDTPELQVAAGRDQTVRTPVLRCPRVRLADTERGQQPSVGR